MVIDGLDYGRHSFKVLRATEVYSPIDDVKDYLFAAAVEIGETDDCRICDIESVRREDNETGEFGSPNRKEQRRI